MPAVWVRFRAEFRRRWRAWVGLGLVFAIAVGLVAAVAAGARRTDSAADRFHDKYLGFDAFVQNYPDRFTAVYDPEMLQGLDGVVDSTRVRVDFGGPKLNTLVLTPGDDRFGRDMSRMKLLDGRLPDPNRIDEVVMTH